jgi:hypothetical protein
MPVIRDPAGAVAALIEPGESEQRITQNLQRRA